MIETPSLSPNLGNPSVTARLSEIEERLAKVEAELAIHKVINRYGLAVDCGDIAAAIDCHTTDAEYIVSAPTAGRSDISDAEDLSLHGAQEIGAMLQSDIHQSLLPNCAHTVGPFTISVDGNNARATGYSRIYHAVAEQPRLMRLGVNEWLLCKVEQRWLIQKRVSRLLGEAEAQVLLKRAAF